MTTNEKYECAKKLDEIAEKIKLVYGIYYCYDDFGNYVNVYDGTPCTTEYDYRHKHFRIYCDVSSYEIWLNEYADSNSYTMYNNNNIVEFTWGEIESYLDYVKIDEYDCLNGEILIDFIDYMLDCDNK